MAEVLEALTEGDDIERQYLAHYINATPGGTQPTWVRLGEDLEEYNQEMSANVDSKRNILGHDKVKVTGYEEQGSVDPYYAKVGEPLFEWLLNIKRKKLTLGKCKTQVLTVYCWLGKAGAYEADEEDAVVEISSFGGDTNGVNIPFNVHYTGENKQTGTFDLDTKKFTPGATATTPGK